MRNYYIISQNKSYKKEILGGFIWCPKTNKNGTRNKHYENVRNIKAGDIIFSRYKNRIANFGIATTDSFLDDNTIDLDSWNKDGYKVKIHYLPTDSIKKLNEHFHEFKSLQFEKYAPFNKNGLGCQAYAYHISEKFASYFINQFIENGTQLYNLLISAYSELEYISDEVQALIISNENKNGITTRRARRVNVNHESEQLLRNKELGDAGEQFVLDLLKNELGDLEIELKNELVIHAAKSNEYGADSAGYDIITFSSDDKSENKYIEVKTTTLSLNAPFYLSRNELDTALRNPKNYYIYRVYNFPLNPKVKRFLFQDIDKNKIMPIKYQIKL